MSDDYKFYPEKFLSIRKQLKLEQKEIASRIGCDRNMMWRYETGRTKPSISKIKMMADILNISSLEICSIDFQSQKFSLNKANNPDNIKNHLRFVRNMDPNVAEDMEEYINSLLIYKKSYESLKQNNVKYTEIIDMIGSLIYAKNTELKYTHVNKRFLDLITPGKRRRDVLGKSNSQLFSKDINIYKLPKDFNEIKEIEVSAINLGTEQTKKGIKIPGTERTGNISVVPISNSYGKVIEIIITINDNTEQLATISQQQNYLKIINDLDSLVWIKRFTPEPHYLFMSNSCYKLTGYTREELMGNPNTILDKLLAEKYKNDISIIDPETCYFIPNKIHRVEIVTKNGIKKWCNISIKKTIDEVGEEIYYGTYTDITDDVNQTYFMQHLNSAFETAGLFIFTGIKSNEYHLPFKINFISSNIEAVTFCPKSQMEKDQTNIRKYIHPDYLEKYIEWINQDIEILKTKDTITKVVNKEKTKSKWLYVEIVRQDVDRYCGTVIDITKITLASERLKILEQAINNSTQVVFIFNKGTNIDNGAFQYISNNIKDVFGYSDTEVKNKPGLLFKYIHPHDQQLFLEQYDSTDKEKQFEFRYIDPSTKIIKWVYILASRITNNQFIGFATDISKYKTAERERKQLQIAIECSDQLVLVANSNNKSVKLTSYSYIDNRIGEYYNASKADFQNDVDIWFESIDIEYRDKVKKLYKSSDFPKICQYKTKNRKGEEKWVSHRTIKSGNNYNSYITDITDSKEAMQREEIIKRAMDNTKLSIKIKKSFGDNSYIYINKGTEIVYKVPRDNFYKDPEYWRTFIPKNSSVLNLNVQYRKPREGSYQDTYQLELPDGTLKTVYEVFYKAKILGDYYQCSIITDITNEKQRETRYTFLEKMIDNIEDFVWISKPYSDLSKCLFMNTAVEKIYGISKQEAFNNPMFWLDAIVPESREEMRKLFLTENDIDIEMIYEIIRPDGTKRKLLERKYRQTFQGITFDFGITKDITDSKYLQ